MIGRSIAAAVVVAAALTGCGATTFASISSPYPTRDPNPTTRVMLVAGGNDVANFAEEVARQRRLWRHAGVAKQDIACYWAKPTEAAFLADRRQYAALEDDMADCAEASAARVLDDIEALAGSPPDALYLYITAHGVPRLGGDARSWVLAPEEQAFLAQPALALDGDPRLRVGAVGDQLAALRDGALPADRIALTPASLKSALAALPAGTEKIVVLQGCYSGAFLAGPNALVTLANTTVLTAAARDRPSFGCGAGTRETFWGGALGRALEDHVGRGTAPERVPWHDVHLDVAARVRRLEHALGQRPSRPQFATSARQFATSARQFATSARSSATRAK
jgi:Peptidase C13 family